MKDIKTENVQALSSDGEVYTAMKKTQIILGDAEDFLFEESQLLGVVNGLRNLSDFLVLNWIKLNINYNNDVIIINKFNRLELMKYADISESAVVKAIRHLKEKAILVQDESCPRSGTYHVNPAFIWKGDRKVRKSKLKHVLEIIQANSADDSDKEQMNDIKRYEDKLKLN